LTLLQKLNGELYYYYYYYCYFLLIIIILIIVIILSLTKRLAKRNHTTDTIHKMVS